jgi:hypothetical protein
MAVRRQGRCNQSFWFLQLLHKGLVENSGTSEMTFVMNNTGITRIDFDEDLTIGVCQPTDFLPLGYFKP